MAFDKNYIVRPAAAAWASGAGEGVLAGYQLTKTNKIGNGAVDYSDNDAALTSGATPIPQIRIAAASSGQSNHNYDFGFKTLASLGDKVWLDNGAGGGTTNNGTQDGTEPGVAGVTVTLYASNGTTVLGTTITDAYGNYLFDNLAPATYVVGFTLPANYQFEDEQDHYNQNRVRKQQRGRKKLVVQPKHNKRRLQSSNRNQRLVVLCKNIKKCYR